MDQSLLKENYPGKTIRITSLLHSIFKRGTMGVSVESNLRNILRKFVWPDFYFYTIPSFVRKVKEISHNYDAIILTSPPPSFALIGIFLKKKISVPLILDFRDPWSKHPVFTDSLLKKSLSEIFERKTINAMDSITTVTSTHCEYLKKKYPFIKEKIYHIPHGFDEEDFKVIRKKKKETFEIAYVGGLAGETGSGKYFFNALKNLVEEKKIPKGKLKVKIVGYISDQEKEIIKKLGLSKYVDLKGFFPRKKALEELQKADAAWLSYKGSPFIVPSKLYEYIGSGKPILATVDKNSEIAQIIKDLKIGIVCNYSNVKEIEKGIMELLDKKFYLNPNKKGIQQLSIRTVAKNFAEILDKVSSGN